MIYVCINVKMCYEHLNNAIYKYIKLAFILKFYLLLFT
jgi:hypothetical protein